MSLYEHDVHVLMLTLGWNYRRLEAHEDQLLGTEALHNDAWLVGAESSPSIHTGRTAAVRRTAGFSGVGLELGTARKCTSIRPGDPGLCAQAVQPLMKERPCLDMPIQSAIAALLILTDWCSRCLSLASVTIDSAEKSTRSAAKSCGGC